ncbi:MAG: DUF4142 domain-containing protein [Cytophagaceae bacterium]|nr:MAG: DUF4142 domain-containing protein [Cytophagaceae bacterium]
MKLFFFPVLSASLLLASCSSNSTTDTTTTTGASADSSATASTAPMAKPDSAAMKGGADPMGPTAPHADDKEFMMSAAHSDQNEMQLSKIALTKDVSAKTKAYANQMIADHTKSTNNLKPIAAKASVTLPTDMDADHKAMAPEMEKLSGKAFEDKYLQQMVADHQKTANTLKAHETMTKNTALQGWISTTLPVVEGHLSMAKKDGGMSM